MTDEIKEVADNITNLKEEAPKTEESAPAEQPQQQQVSVEQVLANYPIDRERIRDTILLNISRELTRIANALDYFASKDVAKEKAEKVGK